MIGISHYLCKQSPFLHIHGHIHENKRYSIEDVDTISVYGAAAVTVEEKKVVDYFVCKIQ